jgi:hypothetical protein
MNTVAFALLPPLLAPKGTSFGRRKGWGGVLFASDSRALPPPNLPLQTGGGAEAGRQRKRSCNL